MLLMLNTYDTGTDGDTDWDTDAETDYLAGERAR